MRKPFAAGPPMKSEESQFLPYVASDRRNFKLICLHFGKNISVFRTPRAGSSWLIRQRV